jgi:hypothetical protein
MAVVIKRRQIGAIFSDFSFGKIVPGDHHTRAEQDMHFLTALIVIFGLTMVLCLALIKLIGDLLRISVHVPPDILAVQYGRSLEPEPTNTTEFYETINTR